MERILRAVLAGVVVGAVAGAVARVLMRVVAITALGDPEFSVAGTAGILLLFCVSGAGAGAAAALGRCPGWLRGVLVVVTSALVATGGVSIGLSELGFAADRDVGALRMTGVVVLAVAILALVVVTPYAGYRRGRRWRGAP